MSDGAGGIIDGRERTGIGDRPCASGYGWTIHTVQKDILSRKMQILPKLAKVIEE